ncbi:MAG TPA: ABC transporter permease [Gemmataceae bacterium]|jgi:lipopolysaccharide transport system permease protein|nr:ABC transporter permease [Gemmataceae bacterium]
MSAQTENARRLAGTSEDVKAARGRLAQPITVIRPSGGWQLINFRELWQYRDLLYFLAWRDVKVRYKQTVLGATWAILQPAMMMVVFTIFFSRMAGMPSGNLPYPIFVFAGLLPWTFFATAVASAGSSVVGSERLITKIYFPRLAIPAAAVAATVVDFAIGFGLLVVLMLCYGVAPGVGLFLAPVVFAVIALAALGVGTLLAALSVSYRDFRYVIPFMVQLWMFATPTVYMQPDGDSHHRLQRWMELNPMTGLIASFRCVTLGGPVPWAQFGIAAGCAALMLLVGCSYFRKVEDHFADII